MSEARESTVETYLTGLVNDMGGLCIKLNPGWYIGIPDRLVLLPRARIGFAELKRPVGGRKGNNQDWWRKTLRGFGFKCEFLNSHQDVDAFLANL